jgi:hypothetical protein
MEWPETMEFFHEGFGTNNRLRPKDRLAHEHLFINLNDVCVSCATCGEYYCKSCGRLVGNQIKTIPRQRLAK